MARYSNGLSFTNRAPELDSVDELAALKPEKARASSTPGIWLAIFIACCMTSSVRWPEAPGGRLMTPISTPWSCSGMNPLGVAVKRQPVISNRPA